MNKFFLDQHGCAKNQVDGEILITRLLNKGFAYAETPEEADVILINTCGFIESAKKESLESVFAALSGWLFLNEILTAREFIGCIVVFIAVIYVQLPSFKKFSSKQ